MYRRVISCESSDKNIISHFRNDLYLLYFWKEATSCWELRLWPTQLGQLMEQQKLKNRKMFRRIFRCGLVVVKYTKKSIKIFYKYVTRRKNKKNFINNHVQKINCYNLLRMTKELIF